MSIVDVPTWDIFRDAAVYSLQCMFCMLFPLLVSIFAVAMVVLGRKVRSFF